MPYDRKDGEELPSYIERLTQERDEWKASACDLSPWVKRAEKAEAEVERLRAAIADVIEDWKEQATADELGWSYRRGNNTFNEGAAFVLRHTLPELEAILAPCSTSAADQGGHVKAEPGVATTPDAIMAIWREVVIAMLHSKQSVVEAVIAADQVVKEHSTRLAALQASVAELDRSKDHG